jgi:hypothetical protein
MATVKDIIEASGSVEEAVNTIIASVNASLSNFDAGGENPPVLPEAPGGGYDAGTVVNVDWKGDTMTKVPFSGAKPSTPASYVSGGGASGITPVKLEPISKNMKVKPKAEPSNKATTINDPSGFTGGGKSVGSYSIGGGGSEVAPPVKK